MWAQKWQPWHAKHVASLLITCLGPCKQKIACGHAPPLVFFQKVMPQQQRMHSTKQTATTQEMQTRCWKQQTGPLKSDGQGLGYGGKKNLQTHSFDFPKTPAAKKNGSYKSVTATRVIFSPREQHPPTPIAHTHGHAKDLGPNQAVWAAIIFAALMQQNWSASSAKQAKSDILLLITTQEISQYF